MCQVDNLRIINRQIRRIRRRKGQIKLGRLQGRVIQQEQTFSIFVKFMYLFARSGNVAIRTFGRTRQMRENCQTNRNSKKFYFISQYPKAKYFFDKNNLLVDQTDYLQITQPPSDNGAQIQLPLQTSWIKRHESKEKNEFLTKINKLLKELDDEFIKEFIQILEFYLKNKDNKQLVEELLNLVQDENKFPYLTSWRKDKLKIYQIQLKIDTAEFNKKCEKFNLRIHNGVVAQKFRNFIAQNMKQFEEENKSDPLKFLLSKLVLIFGEGLGNQQVYQDLDDFLNLYRFTENLWD